MEKQLSIINALQENNIFISVRKNRMYRPNGKNIAGFKSVLVIMTNQKEGQEIKEKIKKELSPTEFEIEDYSNPQENEAYFMVYCKDASTVSKIADSFNGHPMRSIANYVTINKKSLKQKATIIDKLP
ncbi:MAG TPA: hypothetical protein PKC76_14735 [Saprospiraceae bacterium]|nr:hypothetical protein [Saprospiraceae bacterium]HMP25388.1 hypothetical protein [Saprospiraceae bacterium]